MMTHIQGIEKLATQLKNLGIPATTDQIMTKIVWTCWDDERTITHLSSRLIIEEETNRRYGINEADPEDLTSFSYPATHNARGGHYQARGGRTRRGFRGGQRGDRQGGRPNNRSHDDMPSKRQKMYCEYCTRENHYVGTCRIRQRHERERGMINKNINGSHNNGKVSHTKGNPQLELLLT
jgi:hypothetical protein